MVEVFSQVTAEVSPGFIENFPAQFDIYGNLKQICETTCVTIEYMNDVYNLRGQWNMIAKARNMLTRMIAVYGSHQFSVLVEAAEAISSLSRGVDLEEQVQQEMMQMEKLKQIPNLTDDYNYITHIPVSIGTETSLKVERVAETFVNRSLTSEACLPASSVLAINNPHVSEYDVPALLKADASLEKESHNNLPSSEGNSQHISDINPQEHENSEVFANSNISPDDEDSSDNYDDEIDNDSDDSKEMVIHVSENINGQVNMHMDFKPYPVNEGKIDGNHKNVSKTDIDSDGSDIQPTEQSSNKKITKKAKIHKNSEGVDTFPCNKCDFVGESKSALTDHVFVHSTKPAKCQVCQKVFPHTRYLKRHMTCHGDSKHECDICGKQYKVLKALKDHKKKHNSNYTKPEFKCKDCPKVFCSNYILKCHIETEHLGKKKSFLCQTCGKSFTTKHTLQQHANVHIGARPYKCTDCGKAFSYESALRDHRFIHEGTKKFMCEYPQCKKAFRQRSALKMHEKIHKDLKDFTCEECGRGFTQKQALQRHIRAHEGLKPFSCKLCKRSFGDASIIRRHMKLVHKINKDIPDWREDIVSNVPIKEDTKQKDIEDKMDQINIPVSVTDNSPQFRPLLDGTVKLPPVTTIQGFRHLDGYADHELPLPQSLSVSQEQQSSQFSLSLPTHHDYMINESTQAPQYTYTIAASAELPPSTVAKSLEAPPSDMVKAIYMSTEGVQRLEMEKTDNSHNIVHVQYLDENLDHGMAWKMLNRSSHDVPETTVTIQALQEQQKVCVSLDTDTEVVKDIANAKNMDPDDHEFYTTYIYNSNLATNHYSNNFTHYSGAPLQPTENATDTPVQ